MKAPPFHSFGNRPPSPPIEPGQHTQKGKVLKLLKAGQKITFMDTWESIGVISLREAVCSLKKLGWPIVGEWEHYKNQSGHVIRIKRHHLAKPDDCQGN